MQLHDVACTDVLEELLDIGVAQPDAAARPRVADRARLVGAVAAASAARTGTVRSVAATITTVIAQPASFALMSSSARLGSNQTAKR